LASLPTTTSPASAPLYLDLDAVPAGQRAVTWSRAANLYFPGLAARVPGAARQGQLRGTRCGVGMLWQVDSPPVQLAWSPENCPDSEQRFSVLVQLGGATTARQYNRSCCIGRDDICFLDQNAPFELEVNVASSQLMILQMPRSALLSRSPWLKQRTAEALEPRDAGTALLRGTLLNLLALAPSLDSGQQVAALTAIQHLLAAPRLAEAPGLTDTNWRIRSALACIDACISDPALCAEVVARKQGISRRRLDQLLCASIGMSVTARIWKRRLEQADADLVDPRHALRTVTEIAFGAGFADAAHFTKAFRKCYGYTPSEWRSRSRKAPPQD
jgi:AraC-like DNA-binding protein